MGRPATQPLFCCRGLRGRAMKAAELEARLGAGPGQGRPRPGAGSPSGGAAGWPGRGRRGRAAELAPGCPRRRDARMGLRL